MRDDNAWIETNQHALGQELAWLRQLLQNAGDEAAAQIDLPSERAYTLDFLASQFQLSLFERTVILLCAGIELQSEVGELCRKIQGNSDFPTFGLALALLPDAHWSALAPDSPLRYWRMIHLHDTSRLTTSRLTLDERLLHFLLGTGYLDQRLTEWIQPLVARTPLAQSQQRQVERVTTLWTGARGRLPLIVIQGNDAAAARDVVAEACERLSLQAVVMRAADIPATVDERCRLARLLTREHLLSRTALLIDAVENSPPQLTSFMEQLDCPVLLLGERPGQFKGSTSVVEVNKPGSEEQRALWRESFNGIDALDEPELLSLSAHFNFSSADIAATAETVKKELQRGATPNQTLWRRCREQSRRGLDALAQRITPQAGWDDLVLPKGQKAILRDISRQVHHRATVYEAWGFAGKSRRGLGISALFAGESGTGKTMAAEVLASDLHLDLYRIDLSSVISKYVGETEKNLERLFTAAESSGAILLFDEADALFGKRSEVKDSHDRYANIELAYLLQRMEAYGGLSILTTNMKSALDSAFMRRIRFVVQFPFPDLEQRNEIWQRVFPSQLPRVQLDIAQLARLNLTGGNIRNIAMNAAFLAAEHDKPLCMADLAHAVRMEHAKLEKPINEFELRKWT